MKAATVTVKAERFSGDISIHAAREGGDGNGYSRRCIIVISIHAAREGGDKVRLFRELSGRISIHAAREGGDCRQIRERFH